MIFIINFTVTKQLSLFIIIFFFSLLQNKLFSDIQIEINSENNNSLGKSSDIPEVIHSHKSILKVRAPAFYNHLIEHTETKLDSCNSFLQKSELTELLK